MGGSEEPKLKRFYVAASRDALRDIWGPDGVADVSARMAPAERDEMFAEHLPLWCTERSIIAFNFALWEGPCDRQRERYFRWMHRQTDLSFGVVKKFLLSMASPRKVVESAHDLWAADHTHGVMDGRMEGETRATILLRETLFMATPQARTGISEMIRYILELAGARGVIEKHGLLPDNVLEMRLRWA